VVDLATLTAADFEPLLGDPFIVAGIEPVTRLELRSVDEGRRAFDHRRSFSLVFVGPEAPTLSQGTWPLVHDAFGRIELFLVPIGPGPDRPRYEAVFT
jgi:hypothetical protein